jgi:hypothetical protein
MALVSLVALATLPIAAVCALGMALGGNWRVLASERGAGDRVYHVQDCGIMGGVTYVISQELRRDRFFLYSRIVGRTSGDFPETLAPVCSAKTESVAVRWPHTRSGPPGCVAQCWRTGLVALAAAY